MLPRNVRLSLLFVQLTAIATLMRSIAFERWITVLASLILIVGAAAAQRNRAWGVLLGFAQAIAFPVAFLIGIAPPWFCLVGAIGMVPWILTAPGFLRADKNATRVLAAIAMTGGALGAIAWKHLAFPVFEAVPALTPSLYPHHGFIVAAVAALGIATAFRNRHLLDDTTEAASESTERVRIGAPVRVAATEEASAVAEAEEEIEQEVLGKRMRS